jgi:hypothetical protein
MSSHHLIDAAAKLAKSRVSVLLGAAPPKEHGSIIGQWVLFLQQHAIVLLMQVPGEANAYRMFETLNDRGLKVSQSDLVKNYLYSQARDRLSEAHSKWSGMRAILESFEDDDITADFLRQMIVSLHGPTRKAEVYDAVEERVHGPQQAIQFLGVLLSGASDYAAILNPQHEKWNSPYPASIRSSIEALGIVRHRALRPLMLSIARSFVHGEADKAFRLILSVSVRLTIAGSATGAARSGGVEDVLGNAAKSVSDGTATTAAKVLALLDPVVPKDPQFEEAFAGASVTKAEIARYYLRSLERMHAGIQDPYFIVDDATIVNLEHVLPLSPEGNWPQFSAEAVDAFRRRIGNLALLMNHENSTLRSASFQEKKEVYRRSNFPLTAQIADAPDWNESAIATRQRGLARGAVSTWPIRV